MFFWRQILLRLRSGNTSRWPEAEAFVEKAEWGYGGRENSVPVATLAYSYTIDDERYSGYWQESFPSPDEATTFVNELRGRALKVRYKKNNPEESFIPR